MFVIVVLLRLVAAAAAVIVMSCCVGCQAALLLVNLTSQSLPSDTDMQLDTVIWQGPVVRNEESQV